MGTRFVDRGSRSMRSTRGTCIPKALAAAPASFIPSLKWSLAAGGSACSLHHLLSNLQIISWAPCW